MRDANWRVGSVAVAFWLVGVAACSGGDDGGGGGASDGVGGFPGFGGMQFGPASGGGDAVGSGGWDQLGSGGWDQLGSGGAQIGSGGAQIGSGGQQIGSGGEQTGSGGDEPGTGGVSNPASGTCSLMLDGASGNEPGGQIPVCCEPTPEERVGIDQMYVLLNDYRVANGLQPLTRDPALEAAIQGHCLHMQQHDFFDHTAPEAVVETPWIRAELCGTTANAENIAMNSRGGPEDIMEMWQGSPGHNQNMLSSDATRVGICNAGGYWGQIFGGDGRW